MIIGVHDQKVCTHSYTRLIHIWVTFEGPTIWWFITSYDPGIQTLAGLVNVLVWTLRRRSATLAQGWKAGGSPTTFNNIYLGEKFDARLEQAAA